MVRIDVRYEGDLRTRAVHGPSGAELLSDAPADNQGLGRSFSPTDLLATALATCVLTIMGIAARARGLELRGATASIEKHMTLTPRRRIGRLVLVLHLPEDPGPQARAALEATAHACPVHASLHPDVQVELSFRWGAA
jgi:putative redox protein